MLSDSFFRNLKFLEIYELRNQSLNVSIAVTTVRDCFGFLLMHFNTMRSFSDHVFKASVKTYKGVKELVLE